MHSEDVVQKRANEVVVEIAAIVTGQARAAWKEERIETFEVLVRQGLIVMVITG